ncbi:MAG: hypothetical protein ACJ8F3_16910 [Xanthobacteraceae bacterium]
MRLVGIVPEITMAVTGFERHTFHCAQCGEREQRLVFNRPTKLMPEIAAPALSAEEEAALEGGKERVRHAMEIVQRPKRMAARDAWLRTIAQLRGRSGEQ